MQQIIPRIILAVVLGIGSVFAFIESEYYRGHTIALAEKAGAVSGWMWAFRGIAAMMLVLTILLIFSLFRK